MCRRRYALAIVALTLLTATQARFGMLAVYARPSVAGACSVASASSRFDARGIPPHANSAIWRAWLARWCGGDDLGPATSPERVTAQGAHLQNFRQTGHRMIWTPTSSSVTVQTMWGWVRAAFGAHGVTMLHGTPLNRSWTRAYLRDHLWGAALDPPYATGACGVETQTFAWGRATDDGGRVTYAPDHGDTARTHFQSRVWRPLFGLVRSWVAALTHQGAKRTHGVNVGRFRVPAILWRRFRSSASEARGDTDIRWWNRRTAEVGIRLVAKRGGALDGTILLSSMPTWHVTRVLDGLEEPRCPPPATPTPLSLSGTFAIGDSVMEDAAPALANLGVTVHAVVGMQFVTGAALLESMAAAHTLSPRVVIGLGTNGPMTNEQLNGLLSALRGEQRVVLVTVREPRFWQDSVNVEIRAAANRWPNVRVADWYAASNPHPEWFASDGIHTDAQGGAVYADLVAAALRSR